MSIVARIFIAALLVVFIGPIAFCTYIGAQSSRGLSAASNLAPSAAALAPSYSAKVISIDCLNSVGHNRAQITIQNAANAIPYAKAFVEFKDRNGAIVSANDSYFSPSTVPGNATASAHVYTTASNASSCVLTAIQDGDGNPVKFY